MTKVFVWDVEVEEIPGYPGYWINREGEVFREPHLVKGRNRHGAFSYTTEWRKVPSRKAEYWDITLRVDGRDVTAKIHRLLALTYLPRSEGETQVNHINGDKYDNRLINLEWCTPSENVRHSYRTGLASNTGSRHPRSLLTEEAVSEILSRRVRGETYREISADYGVSLSTVAKVCRGVNWSHVN